jgi:hypothetical protein
MNRKFLSITCAMVSLLAGGAQAEMAQVQYGAKAPVEAVTARDDVSGLMDKMTAVLPEGTKIITEKDGSAGALLGMTALQKLIEAADTITPDLAKTMVMNPDLMLQVTPIGHVEDGSKAAAIEMGTTIVEAFQLFGVPPGQVKLMDGRIADASYGKLENGWALDFRVTAVK